MKTSELIGPALDWAVAKALSLKECMVFGRGTVKDVGFILPNTRGGYEAVLLKCVHDKWFKQCDGYPWGRDQVIWQPSTDWSQGGPIIEREINTLIRCKDWCDKSVYFEARCRFDEDSVIQYGPTLLIAAMRSYVASKLGDEVEIPEELQ